MERLAHVFPLPGVGRLRGLAVLWRRRPRARSPISLVLLTLLVLLVLLILLTLLILLVLDIFLLAFVVQQVPVACRCPSKLRPAVWTSRLCCLPRLLTLMP